jgi:hypothetical protein
MSGKFFWLPKWYTDRNFLGGGGEVAEMEQSGAKSGRLTEGPQRLRYATAPTSNLPQPYTNTSCSLLTQPYPHTLD